MVQNLKVDIIYHLTASDFEMEFNLCGCCRMRLLSDKTTEKKGFVKALARGVSRSRVIIGCGPLFGADGLIKIVATAIGSGLTLCDNKTYGINGDEAIEIINGSTPLVTPDGYFGGCIIESGPQTIILLTENRAFRKAIMKNLIHPYIEEISYIPVKSAPSQPPAEKTEPQQAQLNDNEDYIAEVEADYGEEAFEENAYEAAMQDEHNIEFIMDEEAEQTPEPQPEIIEPTNDAVYDNMYTEIEHPEDIKSRYEQPYTTSESDSMFIASPEYEKEATQDKKKSNLRAMDITIVILVLLLLLAILALVYFVVLRPYTMGISTSDYLKEIFGAASSSTII